LSAYSPAEKGLLARSALASKQGSFHDWKLKGDYFLLTGPLMGDPALAYDFAPSIVPADGTASLETESLSPAGVG